MEIRNAIWEPVVGLKTGEQYVEQSEDSERVTGDDAKKLLLPAKWVVEYDNDTGPRDDGFSEWWIVTNGEERFISKVKTHAERLCAKLNDYATCLGMLANL